MKLTRSISIGTVLAIALLFGASQLSNAQKNMFKVSLTGAALNNQNLTYERVLNDKFTASLSYMRVPTRGMYNRVRSSFAPDNASDPDPFANMTFGYRSWTPEFRFYTSKKREAPKGFYLGLYARSAKYDVESEMTEEVNNTTYTLDLAGEMKSTGLGLNLGWQWFFSEKFFLDLNVLGVGYGKGTVTLDLTNESISTADLEEFGDDFADSLAEQGEVTESVSGNTLSVTLKRNMPSLRHGISFGFRF